VNQVEIALKGAKKEIQKHKRVADDDKVKRKLSPKDPPS
jgi:hypothetical protein